ncbi:MAG TPA: OmpH family outer membrane protein [Bacteroidales bacterium]|nr:OmpH family outer membrane protein [Bacteroidales bacterium]
MIYKLIVLSIIILIPAGLFSQKQIRLGHIDSQKLIMAMPESDSAQKKLQKVEQEFQATLEELQVEFNRKFKTYQDSYATMTELIRSTKESELNELSERIQNFQTQAQQDFERQRVDLFRPIQEKAKKAVDEVAEENGFTYVFDIGPGVGAIVYAATDTEDILPLVKVKLGLKE